MNKIIELYTGLEINLSFDEVLGKLTQNENEIIWNYDLSMKDKDSEPYYDDNEESGDFVFSMGIDEQLNDAYYHDIEIIENIIDDMDTGYNWCISEPEIDDESICFKISLK